MHRVCVLCVFALTLALSCVVRAETFSWEASSSLRSLRICGCNKSWHQKRPQEKTHAPARYCQTHSCAHILTNNAAANMGALIHLGKEQGCRWTRVFREECEPVGVTCVTVKIPLCPNKSAPRKWKGKENSTEGWSLPPTETSPHSAKANTRGRKNHYRHFWQAVITKSSLSFLSESSSPWRRGFIHCGRDWCKGSGQTETSSWRHFTEACACVWLVYFFHH